MTELLCTHHVQELNAVIVHSHLYVLQSARHACSLPLFPPAGSPTSPNCIVPCRVTDLKGELEKELKCRATVILNA